MKSAEQYEKDEPYPDNATPSKLYKYRSCSSADDLKYVMKTIADNEIFLASSWSFNDIFDCRPVIRGECTDAEFITRYVKLAQKKGINKSLGHLIMDAKVACGDPTRDPRHESVSIAMQNELSRRISLAGIYCATEKNDNLLMWSHYADNHKGVCLEFDGESSVFREAMKVIYEKERPVINTLRSSDLHITMSKALITKSIDWEYEGEWRIIRQVDGVGILNIRPDSLTGIVFGAACDPNTITAISNANSARLNPVPLYKAVADERHFSLSIVAA